MRNQPTAGNQLTAGNPGLKNSISGKQIPLEPKNSSNGHKFWNFIDNGESADLQLFGTIESEESWWSDDCVTYRNFIDELNGLGDKKAINVMIHSVGGDVFAANAIYTALLMNKATITGTVIGICASAATIVLMACDSRKIAKNAILMAHNPSVTLWGSYQAEDLMKMADVTNQVKKSIVTAYMERLDKTEEEISRIMDDETWYVGQEAIDAGFCDELIDVSVQDNAFSNQFMVDGVSYSFKNYMDTFVPEKVRKKVQDLSETPQKETGTFFNTKLKPKKGNSSMGEETNNTTPAITDVEALKAAYPEFCAKVAAEAVDAERERLKAIDEIAAGISEDMLEKAKYSEPISAADLAYAQLTANNKAGQQFLNQMVEDLANSGAGDVGTDPNAGYDPESQENAKRAQNVSNFAAKLGKDKRRGK